MSDHPDAPKPEIPPEPGSAQAARGGRISGRVVTVLGVSLALAVVMMGATWFFMW
jgi:hypothetical protein